MRSRFLHLLILLLAQAILRGGVAASEPITLIQQYCADCHAGPDEQPEGGFSLTADFDSAPLVETGPTLKKALDAIEGFEMPPADERSANAGRTQEACGRHSQVAGKAAA